VNALKQYVTKLATAVNMMLYNMFLKQAAAVITASSQEVRFPCTVEVLTYVLSISVVAPKCGVSAQA
jgi:hypothetical protein